jgi:hypothetical protein
MAYLDELRLVAGAAPCGQQPIDAVTGITEDALDVPLAKSAEDLVCNGWHDGGIPGITVAIPPCNLCA